MFQLFMIFQPKVLSKFPTKHLTGDVTLMLSPLIHSCQSNHDLILPVIIIGLTKGEQVEILLPEAFLITPQFSIPHPRNPKPQDSGDKFPKRNRTDFTPLHIRKNGHVCEFLKCYILTRVGTTQHQQHHDVAIYLKCLMRFPWRSASLRVSVAVSFSNMHLHIIIYTYDLYLYSQPPEDLPLSFF